MDRLLHLIVNAHTSIVTKKCPSGDSLKMLGTIAAMVALTVAGGFVICALIDGTHTIGWGSMAICSTISFIVVVGLFVAATLVRYFYFRLNPPEQPPSESPIASNLALVALPRAHVTPNTEDGAHAIVDLQETDDILPPHCPHCHVHNIPTWYPRAAINWMLLSDGAAVLRYSI
jgi:hypothetical protein